MESQDFAVLTKGEKGIEKGKRENALEFLRNGAGIDLVVKSTGFTREEVEKMAETVH